MRASHHVAEVLVLADREQAREHLVCARVAAVLLRIGEDVLASAAQLRERRFDACLDDGDVLLVQRRPIEPLLASRRPGREG